MSIIIQDSNNTEKLDNGLIKLTDANGKSIEINIDDISDASTYLKNNKSVVYDNDKTNLNFTCEITDSVGTVMDEEALINDVKSGKVNSIDVTFEATHSGRNLNDAVYSSESMSNDCNTFLYPYAKPLIKNHDSYEEPLGRVVSSDFDKSEFVEDRDTINVTFRVSDQDAMQKFADGRYKTMSIGAQAKHIKCNVCGKDILKDNKLKFCGHWRGERYADQVATWTMTDMEYKEGSVVNQPADVYAQVKRMKVNKSKGESDMSKPKDGLDDVDSILGTADSVQNGAKGDESNGNPDSSSEDGNQEGQDPTAAKDDVETLKAELKTAKDEIEALKAEHQTTIESKDSEIEVLKAAAIVSKSEDADNRKLITKLAKLNKDLLLDSIKVLNPQAKDEELNTKKASELGEMFDSLKAEIEVSVTADNKRIIKTVKNPGAAVNDNNTVVEDGEEDKKSSNKEATMKDFEEVLNKIMRVN